MNEPDMRLEVVRFSSESDSTNGLLFDITNGQRKFLSYTLEDEYRKEKIMSETRVPAGTYNVTLRTEGGFYQNYTERFGSDFNKGMLWVRDVPGFEYILIHIGNTDENTSGCLLVGDTQNNNQITKDGFIGSSTNNYKRIYPPIANVLVNGGFVFITYTDYDSVD
tara:strand:+ start:1196 stop:1690 length:495 start_codon:yes stop_codon:yes gene_type:complete